MLGSKGVSTGVYGFRPEQQSGFQEEWMDSMVMMYIYIGVVNKWMSQRWLGMGCIMLVRPGNVQVILHSL